MAADISEEEQVEALKTWFQQNGVSLIVGIILSLGAVFGYRAWENDVRETAETASAIYEDLVKAVQITSIEGISEEMKSTGRSLAETLKTRHEGSAYASFAALQMARVAVDSGNYERAVDELNWVLAHDPDESFEIITRIRLAKVLSAQQKHEEALQTLSGKFDLASHRASWEEARGDVFYAMGKTEEARQAYQMAVNSLGNPDAKPYLTMKLADLTTSSGVVLDDSEMQGTALKDGTDGEDGEGDEE